MATDEKNKGFDIGTLAQDDTAVVQLVHPTTGDEIGASVTVYGQDSELFRAEARKAQARREDYKRRNRGKDMPAADSEALFKGQIAACVKSIDGLNFSGSPVTDALTMFDLVPNFCEQVIAATLDRALFIKGLSAK